MQELRELAAMSGPMNVQDAILVLNARIQLRDLRIAELEARPQVAAAESTTIVVPPDAAVVAPAAETPRKGLAAPVIPELETEEEEATL